MHKLDSTSESVKTTGASKSIQTRFIILMMVIVSTLLGIFGFLNYVDSSSQKHQQLEVHLGAIKQRLSQSLPAVIWRVDQDQVQQVLEAELGSDAILGIAVYDEKERLLYSAPRNAGFPEQWESTPSLLHAPHEFIRTVPLSIHVNQTSEALGNVRVHASSRSIEQALQREAIRLFALVLLMNLVIVTALVGVMRWVIMTPLNAVRNGLREISSDSADLSMRLPESPWREFEDVVHHFNAFAERMELALGASIGEVHQTISRIAAGDFSKPVELGEGTGDDTVIARLGSMQDSLITMTAELRQAKQAADQASQAKTDFLANMSHEIRTPLNAIMGMTRLAMRKELHPQQRNQLNKVLHSSNHLLGLINDILDFSKIEAGKLTLENVPFELSDVLDNVITLVAEKAVDKGLEYVIDIDPDVPSALVGDPLRLSQIMVNFSTNALKFTQRGEVVLYVRLIKMLPDIARLRIGVRDTGIGIPADKQSQLFQNFVQADTSNTRQYGGTGLGLAITRRLSQLMNGDVGIQSTEGVGSDFWCEIELTVGATSAENALPLQRRITNVRALVVDDNTSAREVLVRLLKHNGIDAHGVSNGAQALQRLRTTEGGQATFDLVFMDRFMPQMDGLATAGHIQALQLQRPPQMVMLSDIASDDIESQSRAVGIQEVLAKPIHAGSLVNLLARLSTQHADATQPPPLPLPVGTEMLRTSVGSRVLLVEDIEINREVASGLLEDLGIGLTVDFAEHGREALEMLEQQHYDAIFMDMHMPIMDGLEATRAIRQNAAWDHIPIIAMTANNLERDIQRCIAAGMCDFVTKPIDPTQLREAVRRWVVSSQHNSATTAPVHTPPHSSPLAPALPGQMPITLATGETAPQPPDTPATPPHAPVLQEAGMLLEKLKGIEGLDASVGLNNHLGQASTYSEMLRRFTSSTPSMAATIQTAKDANDLSLLAQLSQVMADSASSIGAVAVAKHAQHLAQLARQPGATSASLHVPLDLLQYSLRLVNYGVHQAGLDLGPVLNECS